ncbi:MAG: TrbG/VirB9 family P-type conjugative transfer protein [Sphingomicrobium sp.]
MIRKVSVAAFTVLVCTSAVASADSRIRTLAYNPDEIVRILGKAGIQSTIEFASDERIENVAVGNSAEWQITPNRRASLLFVKPLAARSRTNMTVVTDRRTYMFDLVAGDRRTTPVYALKFSYPNDKPLEAPRAIQQAAVAPPQIQSPAAMTADKLHFDWNTKGSAKLLPARVFDDGAALYLAWNRDTPLPAILTQSDDRREGPVNYRMSGEYIVISPIPANLVLRYGTRSAVLWPSRRIVPVQPAPATAIAGRMADAMAAHPPVRQPAPAQQGPAPSSAVRLANVTALYSDQLTDADHEQ